MTRETKNPAAGDTASGVREALLSGEPCNINTITTVEHRAVVLQRLKADLDWFKDRLYRLSVALDGFDACPDLEPGWDDELSLRGAGISIAGGHNDCEEARDDRGFDGARELEDGL